MWGCYKFRLEPGGEPTDPGTPGSRGLIALEAVHVVDGWNRAVRGRPNAWAPDAKRSLPHRIEFLFGEEKAFNTVHITFQTKGFAAPSYRIEARLGGNWKTLASVKDVPKRQRVHTFDRVQSSQLRVVLEENAGEAKDISPRICEIRIYNETP